MERAIKGVIKMIVCVSVAAIFALIAKYAGMSEFNQGAVLGAAVAGMYENFNIN